MVSNTGFASPLIFVGEDGFVEEVDTDDPRIQGVIHTENQVLYAYGFRSMACVDWTTREIIWERQFETAIQSVTHGGHPTGAIVATSDGNVTLMGYSGSEIAVYDIGESADLGVYWTTSYLAWGSHADGFILETSDFAPVDRPVLEPFSTASVPNLISTSIRGMVAGMIVMIGLLSVQGMFRLGLADERPLGRFAVGERRFAALLALIGGTFGAHKFYQGRDVAYLSVLFFWTGLPTLLGVYESIKYLRFTDQEYQDHLEDLAERDQSSEGDD
jgi:TM2 domain-containing membrane protein YozV